ncbi:hypothetical protein PCANC_13381 [Puccinia coronata f. sp. avenae]|uniref:Uncharacterized protein n=1 Tax=Puccinia coronata f. sp. avenae TaxID=200324 RepID=A0A2N5VTR7_9BASI|nr:hypothetical protein PCANC_13381 [Puccinia coronata f. sp. avenae]
MFRDFTYFLPPSLILGLSRFTRLDLIIVITTHASRLSNLPAFCIDPLLDNRRSLS